MSRTLAQILDKSEPIVAEVVQRLEVITGSPSEDLRLLSEVKLAQRQKIEQLGLDPDDTTGPELYHTLLTKYDSDGQRLDQAIGAVEQTDVSGKIAKATDIVKRFAAKPEAWAIKPAAARRLFINQPPKKLMKHLGYRTLDSMLKREPITTLLIAGPTVESAAWQKTFYRAAAKLSSADYAMRPIELINLDSPKVAALSKPQNPITSHIGGAVAIWPSASLCKANTLGIVLMLTKGIEALGAKINSEKLLSIHPALTWWRGTDHLVHIGDGQPVSFNLHDISTNHYLAKEFDDRQHSYGQQVLWQELVARYKRYSDRVGEILPDVEKSLGTNLQKMKSPLPLQLAVEAVEV